MTCQIWHWSVQCVGLQPPKPWKSGILEILSPSCVYMGHYVGYVLLDSYEKK